MLIYPTPLFRKFKNKSCFLDEFYPCLILSVYHNLQARNVYMLFLMRLYLCSYHCNNKVFILRHMIILIEPNSSTITNTSPCALIILFFSMHFKIKNSFFNYLNTFISIFLNIIPPEPDHCPSHKQKFLIDFIIPLTVP